MQVSCSPPATAIVPGFCTLALAPGPADPTCVVLPSPESLCPLAGSQHRNVNVFLQLIQGCGQTQCCLLPPSPPMVLVLFYVSFQQQLNWKIKMCWDLIPNKNASVFPCGALGLTSEVGSAVLVVQLGCGDTVPVPIPGLGRGKPGSFPLAKRFPPMVG